MFTVYVRVYVCVCRYESVASASLDVALLKWSVKDYFFQAGLCHLASGALLQCLAVRCGILQCVAVCCSVLQCLAVYCSVLQCLAVCCSVLQCNAVSCSVLQCVAV